MAEYIPTTMRYYARPTISFKSELGESFDLKPAFPVQADAKNLETAERWSGTTDFVEFENKPQTGFRVLKLEQRGQGGRAYKVSSPDGYLFDLREEPLLQSFLRDGIAPGGVLSGEWVWTAGLNERRIISTSSPEYKKAVEQADIRAKKRVRSKDLVVGGVYKSITKTKVFLGFVSLPGSTKKQQMWAEIPRWLNDHNQISFSTDITYSKHGRASVAWNSSVVVGPFKAIIQTGTHPAFTDAARNCELVREYARGRALTNFQSSSLYSLDMARERLTRLVKPKGHIHEQMYHDSTCEVLDGAFRERGSYRNYHRADWADLYGRLLGDDRTRDVRPHKTPEIPTWVSIVGTSEDLKATWRKARKELLEEYISELRSQF